MRKSIFILALFVLSLNLSCSILGLKKATPAETGASMVSAPLGVKNVILMISDGCGYNHIATASAYKYGVEDGFIYQSFPLQVGMSTYCIGDSYDPSKAWESLDYLKSNFTDSAAAATAMSTGLKTYRNAINMIGVDDMEASVGFNVVEYAEDNGKSTGVVTSVELSHATPAGFVAHNASRSHYADIAREMLQMSAVDVIMGCGHPLYDNDGQPRKDGKYDYVGGEAVWKELNEGKLAVSDANGDHLPDVWTLIQTREEFQQLAQSGAPPARVVGVAQAYETLQEKRSGDDKAAPYAVALTQSVPVLSEMTLGALNTLSRDEDGFFLMVEGGAVDWTGHANQTGRLIEEELDFCDAVAAVVQWVEANSSWDETLVVVTADHETGCLTGPEKKESLKEQFQIVNAGQGNVPGVEWHSNNHTNSLVPLFAKGPKLALKHLQQAADQQDPVRGAYLDNTELAQTLIDCVGQ
ncbi:alkaline phosphatase [Candidatus Sumerlaeota bacterium]|nr:alkaline phosphatase [Candidatus Sumerlaeota bacterium]